MLYGAIEGGGTKFVCAVGDETGRLLARERFPTTTPLATLHLAINFFKNREIQRGEPLAGIGIGSFGPLDLNPASETYGHITRTPKAGWADADLVGTIRAAFPNIPVVLDTDVNGAALGEHCWGAAQAWDTFIYLTVGTGIGGGALVGGKLVHGLIHPEMGHILLPRRDDDPLEHGVCPFHSNCLEGLASGTALRIRWDVPGETLPPDHLAWDLEAHYLAMALAGFLCVLSPQGIILGGSVMHQQHLFPMIRRKLREMLNGYLVHTRLDTLDDFLVPPGLGDEAGVKGALALALDTAC